MAWRAGTIADAAEERPSIVRPTHGPQCAKCRQSTRSLDHLIGSHEKIVRHGQAKRLCCLEIDDYLEFGGLHDRQIGGLFAPENSPGLSGHPVPRVGYSCAITGPPGS